MDTVDTQYSTFATQPATETTANYSYIESLKGKRMILIDGYRFSLMKVKEYEEARSQGKATKCRWRCSTHCNVRCTAVVHTFNDEIVFLNNNHNHSPSHFRTFKCSKK